MIAGTPSPAASSAGEFGARRDNAAAADLAALGIRAALDRLSVALARAAAAFVRLRAWQEFGFARLDDFARERCGRSGRWLRDLATLGEALAAGPQLAAGLTGADGGRPLGRVAATLVARAAPLGPIEEWIAVARRLGVRDLRDAVRAARAGVRDAGEDTPDVPPVVAGEGAFPAVPAAGGAEPDPDEDRVLLRLPVPRPLLAAFEETLELHRAVEGRQAPIASFIEALVGEAQAGRPEPAAGYLARLAHGTPEARVEAALRRASDGWAALPGPIPAAACPAALPGPIPAAACPADLPEPIRAAACCLGRFDRLEAEAGRGDATALDRQVRALAQIEGELEAALGVLLAAMTERRDWARLQFAGVAHYAEERLGMSRSRACERARLARALRSLPALAAACASGRVSAEAAALVHRILDDAPDSPIDALRERLEAAWVEHAAATTIKRMRDEARAIGRYQVRSRPFRPAAPAAVSAGAGDAAVSDVASASTGAAISAGAGDGVWPRPLSDAEWFASLRREPGDCIRRVCEFGGLACGFPGAVPDVFHPGAVPEGFDLGAVPDVFHVRLREADAMLRLRLPADLAQGLLAAIESARAAAEEEAAAVPWDAPWPPAGAVFLAAPAGATLPAAPAGVSVLPASAWAARVEFVRGRRVPMWVGLLLLLEEFAATWDNDAGAPQRPDDRVYVRDGWRCAAPGCSSRRHLEDHHIVYRSRGGDDGLANRITLCRFHHQRGEHGGLLSVRGSAPLGLSWRLGRADVAVGYGAERRFGRDEEASSQG